MYDIFYLGNNQKLVTKFPTAKRVNSIQQAQQLSLTKLFWFVWNDVTPVDNFLFDIYFSIDNTYDNIINHVFLHDDNGEILKNSIWLLSKTIPISKDEIDYRYVLNAKEWDIVASTPMLYDKFIINSYDDYLNAFEQSTTEMFWCIPNDVNIINESVFNFTYTIKNSFDTLHEFDRKINHVYKNGDYYDGIILCSTMCKISSREFNYGFIVQKKEVDITASLPKQYGIITVSNYEDYITKLSNTNSEFVWVVPDDIDVAFDFDYQMPRWEKDNVHIFKNGLYNDGIMIHHRNMTISKKEYVLILASTPQPYDIITVSNYEDYITKLSNTNSEFVWVVPNDVNITFDFDYQMPRWEKDNVHIFKNGLYNDGIMIHHRNMTISKKEYDYCWYTKKKEVDIMASLPKQYNIVFISYNESNADKNYNNLLTRFPTAKRVHGVKGIHQAHIEAAKLCNTDMFWVVDGDASIVNSFNFDYQVPKWQRDQVFVWQSQNPINDLVYGYGGVKLFPRKETINMNVQSTDMTTSISSKFNAVNQLSNITAFNTSEFETWKSAFRECCKLASKMIDRQQQDETDTRLAAWCSATGRDRPFGDYAIQGARAGRKYGVANQGNINALNKINNFDWLEEQFNLSFQQEGI
jgi:hypothetical protein